MLFPHLARKTIALFPGVLGLAQGVDQLGLLAGAVKARSDIHFVVAGDGPERRWLEIHLRDRGLGNVTIMPMVPPEQYPDLVRSCDILLSFLAPQIRYPVIPSKLADGLAAGLPILAGLPEGDAAAFLRQTRAGLSAVAGDIPALAGHLVTLATDRSLRRKLGRRGRAFAKANLDRERVLAHLRDML